MIIIHKYMTEDLKLGGSELLVYAEIASNVNDNNECIKLQPTIAKDTGLSLKTVYRALQSLLKKNLIKIKRVKDGQRTLNIMIVDNKLNNIIKDDSFKQVIDLWSKCVAREDLNQVNYEAYKYLTRNPDYSYDEFKEAVLWYAETIHAEGYYKTYIYKFSRFVQIYKRYITGGYECESFRAWRSTNKKFMGSDRPYDPTVIEKALLSFDDLGNMEM